VDDTPAIAPRRAAVEKNRVNYFVSFCSVLICLIQTDPSVPEESRQENQKALLRRLNERAEARLTSQGDKVSAEK